MIIFLYYWLVVVLGLVSSVPYKVIGWKNVSGMTCRVGCKTSATKPDSAFYVYFM